ncbi:hypothetical protein [Bacillus wiedmannii]|uniref:hypothetical protein n=1 Tax=Bacillus wiedmannii TaxID=1890302 RepID=UPI0015CF162B|nr:hypothetical protein [Bacillus wiedmannii]
MKATKNKQSGIKSKDISDISPLMMVGTMQDNSDGHHGGHCNNPGGYDGGSDCGLGDGY